MTRAQKQALANLVVYAAGHAVSLWEENYGGLDPELAKVDPKEAAAVVAAWLAKLPATEWHAALPQPK